MNDQIPSRVEYLTGESISNFGDDGADGSTEAAEAKGGKETLNRALDLDKEDGSLVFGVDSKEVSTGDLGNLGLELGDGGGLGDDVADGSLDGGQVKAAEETEESGLNLNEEVLASSKAVYIGDREDVLERVGALDIASDRLKAANDGAKEAANLAETEAIEEVNNSLGELDKSGVAILKDSGNLSETGAALGIKLVN